MNQSNQWHEARNAYYAHKSQAICHDLDVSKRFMLEPSVGRQGSYVVIGLYGRS